MPGKEECVLVQFGSQHKYLESFRFFDYGTIKHIDYGAMVLLNILNIIIVVLYVFQNTYRPFLVPCYNIIQRIVFRFVIIIVVFIFISK